VTLTRVSTGPVTVHYATADGTATEAEGDYQVASGTLAFNAGETSKTVTVSVVGDTKVEPNETFFLHLSSPINASIARAQAIGTIVNDDTGVATACSPRPPVVVASVATGDGRLQVTITAGTQGPNGTNRLAALQFQAGSNALVDVAGETGKSGVFSVPLPDHPTSITFFVRRATPGQPTTVPLTVVDTCGEWPTLVGGGPGAF
jgi:endoglucanase